MDCSNQDGIDETISISSSVTDDDDVVICSNLGESRTIPCNNVMSDNVHTPLNTEDYSNQNGNDETISISSSDSNIVVISSDSEESIFSFDSALFENVTTEDCGNDEAISNTTNNDIISSNLGEFPAILFNNIHPPLNTEDCSNQNGIDETISISSSVKDDDDVVICSNLGESRTIPSNNVMTDNVHIPLNTEDYSNQNGNDEPISNTTNNDIEISSNVGELPTILFNNEHTPLNTEDCSNQNGNDEPISNTTNNDIEISSNVGELPTILFNNEHIPLNTEDCSNHNGNGEVILISSSGTDNDIVISPNEGEFPTISFNNVMSHNVYTPLNIESNLQDRICRYSTSPNKRDFEGPSMHVLEPEPQHNLIGADDNVFTLLNIESSLQDRIYRYITSSNECDFGGLSIQLEPEPQHNLIGADDTLLSPIPLEIDDDDDSFGDNFDIEEFLGISKTTINTANIEEIELRKTIVVQWKQNNETIIQSEQNDCPTQSTENVNIENRSIHHTTADEINISPENNGLQYSQVITNRDDSFLSIEYENISSNEESSTENNININPDNINLQSISVGYSAFSQQTSTSAFLPYPFIGAFNLSGNECLAIDTRPRPKSKPKPRKTTKPKKNYIPKLDHNYSRISKKRRKRGAKKPKTKRSRIKKLVVKFSENIPEILDESTENITYFDITKYDHEERID